MSNSIGWGKGEDSNEISWGQGAYNNTISWGVVQFNSWSGETTISGNVGGITTDFSARVIADGGVIEAKECLLLILQNLE